MKETSKVDVVIASDRAYVGLAAVVFESILTSALAPGGIRCHFLHTGISEDERQRLQAIFERRGMDGLFPIDVTEVLSVRPAYASVSAHYLRLLAPEVLPGEVERYLYLDCDVMVEADLGALFGTHLSGKVVGACRDYLPCFKDAVSNCEDLGIDGDTPYFNSGVLLVDRYRWRAERVSRKALDYCQRHSKHLRVQGEFEQHDQYGLNLALRGRWKELQEGWNYGSEKPYRPESVVHFIGGGKPWSETVAPEFRRAFYRYLAEAGWRADEIAGLSGDQVR